MNDFTTQLTRCRASIDAIDRELLDCLRRRASVVAQVGRLKASHGVTGSYIRPGREAMMLRALLEAAGEDSLPKTSIAAIWRIIIGASTALESPLSTLTFDHDGDGTHAAAQYFGPQIPHHSLSEDAFFGALEADAHAIAVVPYELHARWWQRMPDAMRVFACLPFVGSEPTHLALGLVTPEATGDDISLFYDRTTRHVFTCDGFHTQDAPLAPEGADILWIGAYASPYPV